MKKLLLALALLLPAIGSAQAVCTATTQSGSPCSATTASETPSSRCECVTSSEPFGGHATLANGLLSYWKMEEESGTRVDTPGTYDLTDNNTVGFAVGKRGNAASFVAANAEYLSNVTFDLETLAPSAWTVAMWVFVPGSHVGEINYVGQWNGSRGFLLNLATNGTQPRIYTFGNGQNDSVLHSSTFPRDVWHLFAVQWTGAVIGVSADGGAFQTAAHTVSPDTTGIVFNVGRSADLAGYANGQADELGIWSRALTAQEITDLWNGGAGRFY